MTLTLDAMTHSDSPFELHDFRRSESSDGQDDPLEHRLTCLRTHLVQQLHHALPLHGGPVFDGRAPSDLTVLLLDLWRAALSDERAELAAE